MKTAFVSGHLDLTQEEFFLYYEPSITALTLQGYQFIVGDAKGADTMFQEYAKNNQLSVVVYHMFASPRNNVGNFVTLGGFTSDSERDTAMTKASEVDVAWVRPGREKSGTAKNLARRKTLRG